MLDTLLVAAARLASCMADLQLSAPIVAVRAQQSMEAAICSCEYPLPAVRRDG
jgi:hypothetical protein